MGTPPAATPAAPPTERPPARPAATPASEVIKRATAVVPERTLDVAPGDIAKHAKPAPGATPHGAFAYLSATDGTEAWIVKGDQGEVVGYLRDASQPNRAIEITDPAVWAKLVDGLGLTEQAVPVDAPPSEDVIVDPADPEAALHDDQATPDAAAAPLAPAHAAHAAPPAHAAPAPAVKDGGPDDIEGKDVSVGGAATAADTEEQNGIMVAFVVPEGDAADLVLDHPTALPAGQLHVTLAFLGTTDEVDDEGAFYADVLEALRDVCAEYEPVTASISGIGRFTISGDADAFYYSVDAPELPELRQAIVEGLEENGLDVSREHGFTPHITVCYLKEGEDNPLRRAEPRVLAFDSLVFFYGDQRVTIRLGGQDPDEQDDAQFSIEAGQPGYVDSTAPSAMPDGKAKPNPFAKNGQGKIGSRGGPPIASGAWVSWGNQRGRVDLVVTNGKVPGVEEDITGTADKPAARVVVYSQNGSKWNATEKKVGVSASSLKRSFPLTGGKAGKKGLDDGEAGLVAVLTDYYEDIDTKECPVVDPAAVMAAYGRGLDSWPGEGAPAPREQWALGRTKAFLVVAAGGVVPGYEADHDLLPDAHPLAVKAAPVLTVEAEPEVDQGSAPPAAPVEEKVALTVVEGERIDDATVRSTIAELLRFARVTP